MSQIPKCYDIECKANEWKNRHANTESKMNISLPSFRAPFFPRVCLFDEPTKDSREKSYSNYKGKSAATIADH